MAVAESLERHAACAHASVRVEGAARGVSVNTHVRWAVSPVLSTPLAAAGSHSSLAVPEVLNELADLSHRLFAFAW